MLNKHNYYHVAATVVLAGLGARIAEIRRAMRRTPAGIPTEDAPGSTAVAARSVRLSRAVAQARAYPAYRLLGVDVHALDASGLVQVICRAVRSGERCIVGNHNLHSVYTYHHDPKMREFYSRARYVHIDGMAIVLLGRLLGHPLRREHRVTPIDVLRPLLDEVQKCGWRVYILGSRPGIAARAAASIRREFPDLRIRTDHGYFDAEPGSAQNGAVISRIRAHDPHILIVGMGMPRQEHWMVESAGDIGASVVLNWGGLIDLVAGAVPTPPRWMGRAGLEWLYRLLNDPRRLWRRYLVEPWFVLRLFYLERTGRASAAALTLPIDYRVSAGD